MKKEDILDIINNGADESMELLRVKSKTDPEVYKIIQEIREEDEKRPGYKPTTIDSAVDLICKTFYLAMTLNKTDEEKLSMIDTFLNILIRYNKKDSKAKPIIGEFLERYNLNSDETIYTLVKEKYNTLYLNSI
jgi:hypothetical protein